MRRQSVIIVLALLLSCGALVRAQKPSSPDDKPSPKKGTKTATATPAETPALPPSPPDTALKAIGARAIGPAVMGGRVSDLAFDPRDPWTFYVATAHGGIMKTTDNGGSFSVATEKHRVNSFGAVAVSPSDPKVVWAGSGEPNDRNSSGWGDGVYRSADAGGTWTHVGLSGSKAIARIVPHPADANAAYACAVGDVWNDSPERGLYKTTDAGKTWKAVLQAPVPDQAVVGCADAAIDAKSPDTVYAALYARRRTPWSFTAGPDASGGRDAGGLFRSTDGGATWKKLAGGLPGATGRIGLSVHEKDPAIVYAVVQSDEAGSQNIDEVMSRRGGVFRSTDRGETWTRQSGLTPRPFYFSQVRVDPDNDQRVYVLGFMLHVSEDGGRTWREDRFRKVHPDCHALAVDPRNPKRVLLGTDGGVYQSYDQAATWLHVNTVALGEFYRIGLDGSTPYRICGGLQDNLNWLGPSATRTKDGIVHADWINIEGGDGFYCVFDPDEPGIVYAESQGGSLHRMDLRSGTVKNLRPDPPEGQPAFRFHWSAPLVGSAHARGTMFLAGNRVFELTNRGETWKPISPDLSTRNLDRILATGSGAETYGVVFALAESPRTPGLLWAGTDDGKLWITENGGGTWTDLTAGLPAPAKGQWIANLEPGHADDNVCYLVVSAFRSGTYAPLVYRTADRGKTWQSVAGNLPSTWPARVVRESSANPGLLFAGTELGLYASFDRGASWMAFGGLPPAPVDDIRIHPVTRDLVVATHGRSLFVVDDIGPLEQLTPEVQGKAAHLFAVPAALGYTPLPGWSDWSGGAGIFRGANPPVGATFTVWVRAFTGETVSFAVKNKAGQPVANLSSPGVPGVSRVTWNLKPTSDVMTDYGSGGSKFVPPGEYEVTMTAGAVSESRTFRVTLAPGVETR
jgi:photosystem II stability/assembly factor-like uncharacterized protein